MPEEIKPADFLYRRVMGRSINPDKTINSSAFRLSNPKRPDPEISVDLARMISAEDCLALGGIEGLGVASLSAEVPLSLSLEVQHDPLPDDPAHCLIRGTKTLADCSVLARHCSLVIPPPKR